MASLCHDVEKPGDVQDIRRVVDTIPMLAWFARLDGSAEFFQSVPAGLSASMYKASFGLGWEVAIHPDDLPRILETSGKL
jgi:hypothetical protein